MAHTLLSTLVFLVLIRVSSAELARDRAALQDFIAKTPHEGRLRWNSTVPTCQWTGVTCDANGSSVIALRLPGVGLIGVIPAGTLARLSSLRVLSLRANRLSGALPADFSSLVSLRHLYLQENLLSGEFPAVIPKLVGLTRLDLSGNGFSGQIPFAVNNLTRLTGLFLERNRFSGTLPNIAIQILNAFNVSYNHLNGSIPETLADFPASSFTGNIQLCGGPLQPCERPFFQSPSPAPTATGTRSFSSRKLSTAAIIVIATASAAVVSALLLMMIWCAMRRREEKGKPPKAPESVAARGVDPMGTASSSSKEMGSGVGEADRNRLVFVGEGGGYSFDLEDLLRASAEVLGKGSVGTSYKAVLEEGTTVVVKRLKDVAASRREFEGHVEALGRVAVHANVLPLRAYYYSKDEKLVVYDHLPAGCLAGVIHGTRGSGRTPLDWDGRLQVALAAGRGLSHLHNSAKIPHGNIKANNILLRDNPSSAVLSDFGLTPLFSSATPPPTRAAGYRAPEVIETRRATFKSDVYSYGVLLLELLTGRAPNQTTIGSEEGIDLPRWVQSVVREEWTAEVFDAELMRYPGVEEEMVQLLQIAMACVATMPESRPEIGEVVRMIEEIVSRSESTPPSDDQRLPEESA
ncbi:Non-specific serine/threonine protein kinase protein [Dioscorea alata]|uniref:Non-specific serine/threonine protein kinase protein n=1 Tax=Dioscorea alata TaxID=55571 RepID=A0ACB7WFQ6_DIOAL|nr:Non-specific serine/threonine protein kinase protein [Dioscorea alata]